MMNRSAPFDFNPVNFKPSLITLAVLACLNTLTAQANPVAPTVTNGNASFANSGNTLTITNTPNTIINWQQFGINANETVRFIQQAPTSMVLNRVTGGDPSRLLGTLQSNGRVILENGRGIYISKDAVIDVAGFIATTLHITDKDFLAGKLRFNADKETPGSVVNDGEIRAASGGFVYLVAPQVENNGVMTSPSGEAILAAGNSVELVDSADPSLRVLVSAKSQDVNLSQLMTSHNGNVFSVVNSGKVSANTAVAGVDGKIYFQSAGNVQTTSTSVVEAKGNVQTDGGMIRAFAKGNGYYSGKFDVSGRNGGLVETSGHWLSIAGTHVNATPMISTGKMGNWLLDPVDITITHGAASTTFSSIYSPSTTTTITDGDINAALTTSSLTIQTSGGSGGNGDITFNTNGIAIGPSSGSTFAPVLSLVADRNINNINGTFSAGGSGFSVRLKALTGTMSTSAGSTLNLVGGSSGSQTLGVQVMNASSGGGVWNNAGTINWTGVSTVRLFDASAATLNNTATGILNITSSQGWAFLSDVNLGGSTQGGIINNSGILNVNQSTGFEALLNNTSTGTIHLTSGSGLSVQNAGVLSGTITLDVGTTMSLTETHGGSQTFNNTLINGGGTLALYPAASAVNFTGSVVLNNVALQIYRSSLSAQNLTLQNSSSMTAFNTALNLTASGNFVLDNSYVQGYSTAPVNITAGSITITNSSSVYSGGNVSLTTTIGDMVFSNDAAITAANGTMNLTSAANIRLLAGSTLTSSVDVYSSGEMTVTAAGNLIVQGGSAVGVLDCSDGCSYNTSSAYASLWSDGNQTITVGGGVDVLGGSNGGILVNLTQDPSWTGGKYSDGNFAEIVASGNQTVVSGGDIRVKGGTGINDSAVIQTGHHDFINGIQTITYGGNQKIIFTSAGLNLKVEGGGGFGSQAFVMSNGNNQVVEGGNNGGSGPSHNDAFNPIIVVNGGGAGELDGDYNAEAGIGIKTDPSSSRGSQTIYAASINLNGGSAPDAGAYISSKNADQVLKVGTTSSYTGAINMTAGSGSGIAVGIGSASSDVNLTVSAGSLAMTSTSSAKAILGAIGCNGSNNCSTSTVGNNATISATLNGGNLTMNGTRSSIGSEKGHAAITLTGTGTASSFLLNNGNIGTSDTVLTSADTVTIAVNSGTSGGISQAAGGSIRTNTLSVTARGGGVDLSGTNVIKGTLTASDLGSAGVSGVVNVILTELDAATSTIIRPTNVALNSSLNNVALTVIGDWDFASSGTSLSSGGTATSAGLTVSGNLVANGFQATGSVDFTVASGGNMTLSVSSTSGAGDLSFIAGNQLDFTSGTINRTGNVTLAAGSVLNINGNISTTATASLAAPTINLNAGSISAGNIQVVASGLLVKSGLFAQSINVVADTLKVDGGNITKTGSGKLDIKTTQDLTVTNSGHIFGDPDVDGITVGGTLFMDNGGTIESGSVASVYLNFPGLASGGFVVDGVLGAITGSTGAGFYAAGNPAVLGTNLHVTYGLNNQIPHELIGTGSGAGAGSGAGGSGTFPASVSSDPNSEDKKDEPKECS